MALGVLHLCKTASIEGVMQVRGFRASEVSRAAGNALFSCISAEPINRAPHGRRLPFRRDCRVFIMNVLLSKFINRGLMRWKRRGGMPREQEYDLSSRAL